MNINVSNIISVSEIQKNYRKIFDRAKKTKEPIILMRENTPDIALIDVETLSAMKKRIEEIEIEDALKAISEGDKELKTGKIRTANSLTELL